MTAGVGLEHSGVIIQCREGKTSAVGLKTRLLLHINLKIGLTRLLGVLSLAYLLLFYLFICFFLCQINNVILSDSEMLPDQMIFIALSVTKQD